MVAKAPRATIDEGGGTKHSPTRHLHDHFDRVQSALPALAPLEKVPLETYVPPAKPSLIGLSRAEIADRLGEIGVAPAQRKMRTQQLWHWMYVRGAKDFDEMTSISKDMRAQLEKHFTVDRPEVVAEQVSNDGTRKWLLRLPSGDEFEKAHEVECVYIPEPTAARCAFPPRSAAR